MEEIFKIKENYTMGFITPREFLNEIQDVLFRVGAHGELEDTINKTLAPLADFIVADILNAVGDSKKQINRVSSSMFRKQMQKSPINLLI